MKFVFDNYHCHETDKIVVCTARDCAVFVSFSITKQSIKLSNEIHQLDLILFTYTLFP